MGTIIEKIQDALDSKTAISAAIEAKGVTEVGNVLSTYAGKILSIVELKGETKTVTATTSQQTINPSSGKNGITQITVNPVTSSIDANIVSGNIKDGVSILGVTGDYQGSGGGGLAGYTITFQNSGIGHGITVYKSDGTSENVSSSGTIVQDVVYFKKQSSDDDLYISRNGSNHLIHADNSVLFYVDVDGLTITTYYSNGCFLKGTQIMLSNYSEKNAEDITFDDELLVWDFDNCCLSKAKPIWIQKKQTLDYYFLNKYKSGKTFKTTGKMGTGLGHRVFNIDKKKFVYDVESIGSRVYTLDGIDLHMSCERIDEPCEYYNIITERHINLFANRLLTSCSLNNIYDFDVENMKFIKDGRTPRTLSNYNGVSQKWFDGLRLSENTTDIDDLNKYVHRLIKTNVQGE